MALKTYLFDKELTGMYMSPKHEVHTEDGNILTYRLIEGDSELDIKKQSVNASPKAPFIGQRLFSTEDLTLQKFIESKPYFGTRVTIYDPVALNSERLESKKKSISLLKEVASFERNKIMEIGYVLFGRQALDQIKVGDIDGLHDKIIEYVGNEPEQAHEVINNKNNAERLYAGFLIASNVFEVSVDERFVKWAHNGSTIYTVPNGLTVLDGLVDFFQTKEGKEVKKEASMKIENKSVKTASRKTIEALNDDK